MFGDKPIFGQMELSIDDKNRINIPANTNREHGEELLLIHNQEFKIYEIYSVKRLEERYKELDNLILNSKTKKEKIFYERRLLELSKSILRSSIVDCNGKISIGKNFGEYEKVLSTGAYDHLIIEPIKLK